ncbi:MAG: hypothetical protein CVU88_07440 [Firmicutes bacterium HGW-Firmicutes-13]|nr:MAG: hypothetical protein CVU88_07440 [Firmicutes bacterium HGW-Firmicutes-13]
MNYNQNHALYYPTIEFRNDSWLFAASLIWDKIYRIVPNNYEPKDSRYIKELVEAGDIGICLDPGNYAKEVAEEFSEKLANEDWDAAALTGIDKEYAQLHKTKVDVALRNMIISKGGIETDEKWYFVPTNFAAQYMTYLANSIARKNNLSIITDKPAAWSCSTYFEYNGSVSDYPQIEETAQLASLVIKEFIPANFNNISVKELLHFRRSKKDERQNFMRAINNAANLISNCRDPKIVNDLIHDLLGDIESALIDYKKCIRDLKWDYLTGLYTIFAPIATEIINQTANINSQEIRILSALGVGIGVITSIKEYKKSKANLIKASDFSYLLELRNKWDNVYQGGSYSYYLSRQIEEFIND